MERYDEGRLAGIGHFDRFFWRAMVPGTSAVGTDGHDRGLDLPVTERFESFTKSSIASKKERFAAA